jgi:hypothetical protein
MAIIIQSYDLGTNKNEGLLYRRQRKASLTA